MLVVIHDRFLTLAAAMRRKKCPFSGKWAFAASQSFGGIDAITEWSPDFAQDVSYVFLAITAEFACRSRFSAVPSGLSCSLRFCQLSHVCADVITFTFLAPTLFNMSLHISQLEQSHF